jgi:perosamine synthetase
MTTGADFVAAIRSVVGLEPQVGLHIPQIDEVDHRYVNECLDSTFVSSVGPFVNRFEQEIAAYTGAKHAIAVSNGTVALQVALVLAGVTAGDEVIVPALSFIATANAVTHAGAHPHFIDSNSLTLGMDASALELALSRMTQRDGQLVNPASGRRVAAVVPMHTFGHPAAIIRIVEIASRFGIPVVEDAAESLGSYVGSKHTGTFGVIGVLSFNGNKIVTTGGGGMILTDDPTIAQRAKHLTTTAKLPHSWEFEHDEVGWNFRMPNLNAALGVAQFSKLPGYLANKRVLADRYAKAFSELPGIELLLEPEGTRSNYWLCSVRVKGGISERNALLQATNDDGLQCRPFWNLLSRQSPYREAIRGPLATAEALVDSVISIPSSPQLAT